MSLPPIDGSIFSIVYPTFKTRQEQKVTKVNVNVIVFDSQPETSKLWLELASSHQLSVRMFSRLDLQRGLLQNSQVLVIDQSVVPQRFASTLAAIRAENPWRQIVATGAALTVDEIVDVMQAGVASAFQKPFERSRIAAALPGIVERAGQIAAEYQEFLHFDALFDTLSLREKDVLNYILIGTSNKETAQLLHVSVRTIESRRAKVYRKLESSHIADLVRKVDRLKSLREQFCMSLPRPNEAQATSEPDELRIKSSAHRSFSTPHAAKTLLKSFSDVG